MNKPKPVRGPSSPTEEEWEEQTLEESLGDAIQPDGQIDFDKLRAKGKIASLDELDPESDAGNGT